MSVLPGKCGRIFGIERLCSCLEVIQAFHIYVCLHMPDARSMRFDLIAFDWDGTLFDSTAIITRCIQAAVVDLGGGSANGRCGFLCDRYGTDGGFGARGSRHSPIAVCGIG